MKKNFQPKGSIPKSILAAKSFSPMYQLLRDINNGAVDELNGLVVVRTNYDKASPYLDAKEVVKQWCSVFVSFCVEYNYPKVEVDNLLLVAEALGNDLIELNESTLIKAKKELDGMYTLWIGAPLPHIQKFFSMIALTDNIEEVT